MSSVTTSVPFAIGGARNRQRSWRRPEAVVSAPRRCSCNEKPAAAADSRREVDVAGGYSCSGAGDDPQLPSGLPDSVVPRAQNSGRCRGAKRHREASSTNVIARAQRRGDLVTSPLCQVDDAHALRLATTFLQRRGATVAGEERSDVAIS
ncbi:MAG: hypothetical protein U5K38_16375 [Woeseiaceae bacterium]|nr:hypothetical protein [Woeseiaceae bacterium]